MAKASTSFSNAPQATPDKKKNFKVVCSGLSLQIRAIAK